LGRVGLDGCSAGFMPFEQDASFGAGPLRHRVSDPIDTALQRRPSLLPVIMEDKQPDCR
jgi:hypothetical protein